MNHLGRLLIRIGWTLSHRGAWAALRGAAVGFGTFWLILGLGALGLYETSAIQRTARTQLIQPVLAASGHPARLLVSHDGFTQVLGRPVTIISLWPLSPSAPLPPGVSRWPQPGEAVISPTLARDLATTHQSQLFGRIAGTISFDGLETPTERRVYAVPTDAALSMATMSPAVGFNSRHNWTIGPGIGYLNAADPMMVRTLIVSTLLIPAVVALIIGAGLDGDSRRRRMQLLDVLGASRTHRMIVDSAEVMQSVVISSLLAAAVLVSTLVFDIPLRIVDTRMLADDARAFWPALVAVMLAGPLMAFAVVVLFRNNWRPPRGASPFSRAQTVPKFGWFAFGGVLLTLWLAPQMREAAQRTLVYLAGLLVIAATLPAFLGMLTSAIARLATRGRSAAAIVSGRLLASTPRRTARLTVGVCFAILIVGQAQLWQGIYGEQHRQAVETRTLVGDSVLVAGYTRLDRPGLSVFLRDLPRGVGVAWISNTPPTDLTRQSQTTVVTASCSVLTSLELPCSTGQRVDPFEIRSERTQHLLLWTTAAPPTIRESSEFESITVRSESARLILIALDGGDLPVAQLQRSAYAAISGGLDLEPLGQSYLTQGTILRTQGTWIVLLGTLGVLIVLVAFGAALAGDALAQARALVSLTALSERRAWLVALTLIRSAAPLAVAGGVGSLGYLILARGLSSPTDPVSPSTTLAVACASLTLLTSVLFALWSAHSVARHARTWTPGMDA